MTRPSRMSSLMFRSRDSFMKQLVLLCMSLGSVVGMVHTSNGQTSTVKPVTSADDPSLPFVTFGKPIAPADQATDKDKPPRSENLPSATAWEMVILPDGQTLVTRDSYTQVVYRNLTTGFKGHTEQVIDVETGKELRRFIGHEHDIRDICFSPDSRLLASAS